MGKLNDVSVFFGVGMEGLFGICGIIIFATVSGIRGETRKNFLDIMYFVHNNQKLDLLIAIYCAVTIVNMVSGYLVTHTAGATTRATFNSIRPYLVFVAGLALGLEDFTMRR